MIQCYQKKNFQTINMTLEQIETLRFFVECGILGVLIAIAKNLK